MWRVLVSALWSVGGWFVRSVLVKWATVFALYFLLQEVMGYLLPLIADTAIFQSMLNAVPDGSRYWLHMAAVPQGVPLVVAAVAVRFFIRRLPVVG